MMELSDKLPDSLLYHINIFAKYSTWYAFDLSARADLNVIMVMIIFKGKAISIRKNR